MNKTSQKYHEIEKLINDEYSRFIIHSYFIKDDYGRIKKMRFELINYAIVDVYISVKGKYSFHYNSEKNSYRHDNSPHHSEISTFPKHAHLNDEITESNLPDDNLLAAKKFFEIVVEKFIKNEIN